MKWTSFGSLLAAAAFSVLVIIAWGLVDFLGGESTSTPQPTTEVRCLPVSVLAENPEMPGNVLAIGETELCGINLSVAPGAWGPSLVAHIEKLTAGLEACRTENSELR